VCSFSTFLVNLSHNSPRHTGQAVTSCGLDYKVTHHLQGSQENPGQCNFQPSLASACAQNGRSLLNKHCTAVQQHRQTALAAHRVVPQCRTQLPQPGVLLYSCVASCRCQHTGSMPANSRAMQKMDKPIVLRTLSVNHITTSAPTTVTAAVIHNASPAAAAASQLICRQQAASHWC
jgi:hypothetical protein